MILKVTAKWDFDQRLVDDGDSETQMTRQTAFIAFDGGAVVYDPIRVTRTVVGYDLAFPLR